MSGCGTRIVLRGQKPLALCDRCPCFGSLFPPLAALTFAASSIICAFGLAAAAPRSPYRHLELCGIAFILSCIKVSSVSSFQRRNLVTPIILRPRPQCPVRRPRQPLQRLRLRQWLPVLQGSGQSRHHPPAWLFRRWHRGPRGPARLPCPLQSGASRARRCHSGTAR